MGVDFVCKPEALQLLAVKTGSTAPVEDTLRLQADKAKRRKGIPVQAVKAIPIVDNLKVYLVASSRGLYHS
eukprot:1158269-Pelagomonas_calceolata.AAC.18